MFKRLSEQFNKHKEIIFEIMVIILIILFAVSISPKTLQNDTFYTIPIGKLIMENGIDMQDHFSWHDNLPYTYPHWLYDVGMNYIYNLGGWTGIYISTCVLASILGICIYRVNSKLTKNKFISFFVTIGSLFLLKGYIAARAQLVTFILFILLVYNIERFLEKKKIINVVTILVIQTLIANLHAAVWPFTFVIYLPFIAEYLICEIIEINLYKKIELIYVKRKIKSLDKKIKKNKENNELVLKRKSIIEKKERIEILVEKIKLKRNENLKNPYRIIIEKNTNTRWLILIMIISVLTGLLTPLGKVPYTYTYLTVIGNSMNNINEHLPMTLAENTPIFCTIIIFLSLLIFTKTKIKLSDLFFIGGLAYLMLMTRRQASMFALIGTITLTRMITNFIENNSEIKIEEIVKKSINVFSAFVISVVMLIWSLNNIKDHKDNEYINESLYPVQASEWILENLDVKDIKLYNEYNYGSYLIFKGIPVFIDSRADLYLPEFNTETGNKDDGKTIFDDFMNCSNLGTYYGDIFEQYHMTHVLAYENSKINMLIKKADSEKYKLLYSDDHFVLYEILK